MANNIRQSNIALGKVAQADLTTANSAGQLIRVRKTNTTLTNLKLVTEDDAQFLGKDDEFPTQNFLTNWDVQTDLEMPLSSEMAAWAFAFGLGNSAATSPTAGAYRHTAVMQTGIDGIPFTLVEKLPSDGSVFDRAFVGCVLDGWSIKLSSGPGINNATLTLNVLGTGKFTTPSGLSLPSPANVNFLNASAATAITLLGTNYVGNKRILGIEIGMRNNTRSASGFFPGSGTQSGAAIRGRMEHGDRELTLTLTIRADTGGSELAAAIAQTEGTGVIGIQGALISGSTYNDMQVTFQRLVFGDVQPTDADGIAALQITAKALKHSTNGLITAYATNTIPLFGAET